MYCFKCGAELDEAANFCLKCGARVGQSATSQAASLEPPPLPPAAAVSPPPLTATSATTSEVGRYAGFWRRVAAAVIDGFVQMGASIALVVLVVAAVGSFDAAMDEDAFGGLYYLFSWLVGWLYYALMHSSSWQATVGKRALGIKVTSLSGERIGFGRATGRFFATFLSAIILGIGYLMAAFTARKQALHDMIAGTLVVSRNTTPEAVSAGLAAPRLSGGVIAVAVLVALIPVTGMLAAIAIPAYNDYTLRSQVTEGLLLSSEYKAAVAEALYNGTDADAIDNEAIGLPTRPISKYVANIEVAGGVIQITYGGEAGRSLQDGTVTLVPGVSGEGEIVWTCGHAEVPAGVAPFLEDHGAYTNVEPKYLPSSCR